MIYLKRLLKSLKKSVQRRKTDFEIAYQLAWNYCRIKFNDKIQIVYTL